MSDIHSIQNEIIDEFGFFDNWTDKYEHIIAFAKGLGPMAEQDKTDENLVRGCQSRVWLTSTLKDGLMHFTADSEAVITKGLVALMVRVFDKQRPEDVLSADLYFVDKIGLKEHLSPNRANGLLSMIKRMREQAAAHVSKQ